MPGIERGDFMAPAKSAWNFETYDSGFERQMMTRLDQDPAVRKWTKKHGIVIPWTDARHRQRRYIPDFLVEYNDNSLALIEVKAANRVDSAEVQRKRFAAEQWCRRRDMQYEIATLGA